MLAVRDEGALRMPCRAGRIDDECWLLGTQLGNLAFEPCKISIAGGIEQLRIGDNLVVAEGEQRGVVDDDDAAQVW